jgi:transposase
LNHFSKKPAEILMWIDKARKMKKISELQSYIEGLTNDLDAVKNAIKYDYNNGLAEGSVTKIKLIKKVMYGRNSFQMLRAKVLLHELLYDKIN